MIHQRSRPVSVRLALWIAVLATLVAGSTLYAPVASAQPSSDLRFLCANSRSGTVFWSETFKCPARYVSIDLATDAPVIVCAIRFVGFLRLPNDGECRAAERPLVLGGESPTDVCLGNTTRWVRHNTGTGCFGFESEAVAQGKLTAGCDDCYTLVNILDDAASQGYTTSELLINDPRGGRITDVNVTVDIAHSYSSDLRLFLRAPDGTNILLFDQLCDDSDSVAVTFDDEATSPVDAASCPLSGLTAYQPAPDALAAFDGSTASGVWTLIAIDIFLGDEGALNAWSLDIMTSRGPLGPVTCTDCPIALSENNVGIGTDTSTATVAVENAGTIADVNVVLDLSGGWAGEFMTIALTSPAGSEILLYDAECVLFNMADLEVVYDDEAVAPLTDADCPASGFQSFQPSSAALASLAGENPNGIWTLSITTSLDFSAILWNWSLQITTE